ncbi:MAG: hypothetical protein IH994_07450 [Proteobacteria bacterium]|nr:hypothetical protein [Pseudomonadota bacterium]
MTEPALDRLKGRFRGTLRGVKTVLVPALLAAGLGACGVYEYVTDKISDPIVLRCPEYLVVADAANLVRFRDGPGRDLIDVDFETKIIRVQLVCTSNIDKRTRVGTLDVEVTVTFRAERGPANRSREGRFDFFISVVGSDQKILYREVFAINVGFPGNKTRLLLRSEPVILEIPITPKRASRSFRIFAGLKLSRDELEFNRQRRQKTGG